MTMRAAEHLAAARIEEEAAALRELGPALELQMRTGIAGERRAEAAGAISRLAGRLLEPQ